MITSCIWAMICGLPRPRIWKVDLGQFYTDARPKQARLILPPVVPRFVASRGHCLIVGTPSDVADLMGEWFATSAADGFSFMAPYFPGGSTILLLSSSLNFNGEGFIERAMKTLRCATILD